MLSRIIFSLTTIVTASIAMGGTALASATSGGDQSIFNIAIGWVSYTALAVIGAACAFVVFQEIAHTRDNDK